MDTASIENNELQVCAKCEHEFEIRTDLFHRCLGTIKEHSSRNVPRRVTLRKVGNDTAYYYSKTV